MDLNQLYHHHGLAVLHATQGDSISRFAAFDLAGYYRRRIARLRDRLGAPLYPEWWPARADHAC